jgi:autotransporter-associated beta strand protein
VSDDVVFNNSLNVSFPAFTHADLGANQTINSLTISGPLTISNSGSYTINIAAGLTDNAASTSNVSIAAGIVGSTSLTLDSQGNVLTLSSSGASTYSGDTVLTNGTLQDGQAYSYSAYSVVKVDSGGTLNVGHNESVAGLGDSGSGQGNVSLATGATLFLVGSSSDSFTGSVAGQGNLQIFKSGSGSLTLANNGGNTYSGDTVISTGTLQDGAEDSFSYNSIIKIDSGGILSVGNLEAVAGLTDVGAGGGQVNFAPGGFLSLEGTSTDSFTGSITGPGGLQVIKSGDGTLLLSNAGGNTYSGDTVITTGTLYDGQAGSFSSNSLIRVDSGGTLNVGYNESVPGLTDSNSGGGHVTLASGATLALTGSSADSLSATITGLGGLQVAKSSGGSLTLASTGANTYSGDTSVTLGTLQDGAANAFSPNSAILIDGPGVLQVAYDETIQGIGDYSSTGNGSVVLGYNSSVPNLTLGGTGTYSFSGSISGQGQLLVAMTDGTHYGTQVLTGSNSYAGDTIITAGVLTDNGNGAGGNFSPNSPVYIDGPGELVTYGNETIPTLSDYSTGGGTVQITNPGTALDINGSMSSTFSGNFTGDGNLKVDGNETLTLTGASPTFYGATEIGSGATIQLGDGILDGNIDSTSGVSGCGGTLVFNSPDGDTFASSLSGYLNVSQISTGVTIFTGTNNTYSGNTIITKGLLQDDPAGEGGNFSPNSAIYINAPGVLIVNGNETILTLGDNVSGGASVQIPNTGTTLDINGPTNSTFSGAISGYGNLKVDGTEILTLTGTNTYSGSTEIGSGATIRLGAGDFDGSIDFTSGVSGCGGTLIFNSPDGDTFSSSLSGDLNVFQTSAGTTTLTGTSNTYTGNTVITHGTFQDDPSGEGSNLSASSVVQVDSPGTLQVNQNETIAGLSDYTSHNGGSVVIYSSGTTLEINGSSDTTFSGVISGCGNLKLDGDQTLILTNSNTYTGTTEIGSGATLQLGDGYCYDGSLASQSISGCGGTLVFDNPDDTTYCGSISGYLNLSQVSCSTTTLMGTNNSYTGSTIITKGVFQDDPSGGGGNLSANSVVMIDSPGTLQVNQNETIAGLGDNTSGGGSVVIYNSGTTLEINGSSNTTFSGVISGCGNLKLDGDQTLILTGSNTYTGTTEIGSGATLQLGDGYCYDGSLASQSISGCGGTLVFDNPDDTTYCGSISGYLNLSQVSCSTTTLMGTSNTYTGSTVITKGTLQDDPSSEGGNLSANSAVYIDSPGTLKINNNETIYALGDNTSGGGSVVIYNTGTTLEIKGSDSTTFSGVISGCGNLKLAGCGTLTLTNAETYAGSTQISSNATIQLGDGYCSDGSLASQCIYGSGTLVFDNPDDTTYCGSLTGCLNLSQVACSTLTLMGTSNTYSGLTVITAGKLQDDPNGSGGNLSPNSVVELDSPGKLKVNYNETIAGLSDYTSHNGGKVEISNSGTTLEINGSGSSTFSGVISGCGNLKLDGDQTLSLTGSNTYTGTTQIGSGATLQLGDGYNYDGSLASQSISGCGGTLVYNNPDDTTYCGSISGYVNLSQVASSTTTLMGTSNTYTGNTVITKGTLQDDPNGEGGNLSASSAVYIDCPGTLKVNYDETIYALGDNTSGGGKVIIYNTGTTLEIKGSDSTTFSGVISGCGNLKLAGCGTLTLTNAETYTGSTQISSNATIQLGDGYCADGSLASQSIYGSGTLVFDNPDDTTYCGSISGCLNLTQASCSTTTLTGTCNTYSGLTIITRGTLQDDPSGEGENLSANSVVKIDSPGTLQVNQNETIAGLGDNTSGGGSVVIYNPGTTLDINGSSSTTFSGVISGCGNLKLDGTGTLTLTNAETYTGTTQIGSGATIQLGDGYCYDGSLASQSISGCGGTLVFDNPDNTTYCGSITGYVNLSQVSCSTTTLMGTNNTYTGDTVITRGALQDDPNGSGGNLSPNSQVLIDSPGSLFVNYNETIGGLGDYSSGQGSVQIAGGAVLTVNSDFSYFSGDVSGQGGLTLGSGTILNLVSENDYTGPTVIGSSATLILGDGAENTGTLASSGISGSGTLLFQNFSSSAYSGAITGCVSVSLVSPGTVTLTGPNTYSGPTTIQDGALADGLAGSFSPNSVVEVDTPGTLSVNFNESIAGLTDSTSTSSAPGSVMLAPSVVLSLVGSGSETFSGYITGQGALTIAKSGSGSTTLAGQNDYVGGTFVNVGELLLASSTVGSPGSITSGPAGVGDLTLSAGATLAPAVTDITLANDIILEDAGNAVLGLSSSSLGLTANGTISGQGGLDWEGAGALTLTGTNLFSGGVTVGGGTLLVGNDQALGTGGLTLNAGSTLAVDGTGAMVNLGNSVAVSGNVFLGTFDNNILVLNGALSGTGNITYQGLGGTLALNPSSNTVVGSFTVAGGTVVAENGQAFGSTPNAVAVENGSVLRVNPGVTIANTITFSGSPATLEGNGTISSALTANSSAIIAPQTPTGAPGELTFSGGLSLQSGSAITFTMADAAGAPGTGTSLITTTGGLDFSATAGSITFNVVSTDLSGSAASAANFSTAVSNSWMFASSTSPITGFNASDFTFNTSGFLNGVGTGNFFVSETGNDLFLNFTPVPEPSTWALMGLGALALGGAAWRRRKQARA